MAVKQRRFGEHAIAPALRVDQDIHLRTDRNGLAQCPDLGAIGGAGALAFGVVGIGLEVRGLQVGKGFQLKAQARVTGRHGAVVDVLAGVAEVAGHAQVGPCLWIVRRVQAVLQVGRVVGIGRGVRRNPLAGWAVAAFAAHTIGDLVAGVRALRRRVVGMAIQALFGLVGRLGQA